VIHHASCLCGDVRWEVDGPIGIPPGKVDEKSAAWLVQMSNCHCSRCRKHHGAPFGTYLVAKESAFRMTSGREAIIRYESAPGAFRPFCGRCGSTVPDGHPWKGRVGMPAANFDSEIGLSPKCHIFWSSRASWVHVRDDLPKFDAYPEGFDAPVIPDRDPGPRTEGVTRGSCLCGEVAYALEGRGIRSRTCHCSRCRRANSAPYVAYLTMELDRGRFTRGEERVRTFKDPSARYFKHAFCATCGSSLPRGDAERGLFIVPMGTLDDDPPRNQERHIFVGSKLAWDVIADDLPQDLEHAPG
jgi:hypothetical protein